MSDWYYSHPPVRPHTIDWRKVCPKVGWPRHKQRKKMADSPTQEVNERLNLPSQENLRADGSPVAGAMDSAPRAAVKIRLELDARGKFPHEHAKQEGDAAGLARFHLHCPASSFSVFRWCFTPSCTGTLRTACDSRVSSPWPWPLLLFKVRLPGIEATMSANFVFILLGILDFSFPETLMIGCLGGLAQSLWQAKPRPRPIQMLFNFANLSLSISAASFVFHSSFAYQHGLRWPLLVGCGVHHLFRGEYHVRLRDYRHHPETQVCHGLERVLPVVIPLLLIPGAIIAGGMSVMNRVLGWQVAILVLPSVYWIYRSYSVYLNPAGSRENA